MDGTPLDQLTDTVKKSVLDALEEKLEKWCDNTIEKMTEKMRQSIEDTALDTSEKTAKRIKLDNPELKKPGNVDQFKWNTDIMEKFDQAERNVKKGDGAACLKSINEGKTLVKKRQKLVKLADREEGGWHFVKEYEKDTLADDSEDEKKISKTRKNNNYETGFSRSRGRFRGGYRSSYRPYRGNRSAPTTSYSYENSYRNTNSRPFRGAYQNAYQRSDFRRNRFDRECYVCHRRGHISYNCPNNNSNNNNSYGNR